MKLFKRELFGDIRYPVGRLREDDATIYKLYLKANQIHFTNEGTYYYSQRAEGLSRTAMHDDIATMVSNAEERISLMVALGYNPTAQITSYVERLKNVVVMPSMQVKLISIVQSVQKLICMKVIKEGGLDGKSFCHCSCV